MKEATLDLAMQALDARDREITSHGFRVAELAALLTQQLDLGRRDVEPMRMAGMLHDLGMIGVRDDILYKPGPLREEELEILRRHPDIGADMIAMHPALAAVAPVVRHHHERWDGSGYPAGFKGEVIPLGARILAVAESFDFITNKWGYRANLLTPVEAIRDISEYSGSWYDPAVVDALCALYGIAKPPTDRKADGLAVVAAHSESVADVLGIKPEQLLADLKAGQKVSDLAKDRGMSAQQFADKLVAALRPRFETLVDRKQITQAQADSIIDRINPGHIPFWNGFPRRE